MIVKAYEDDPLLWFLLDEGTMDGEHRVDVPDELVARYKATRDAFMAVQDEICAFMAPAANEPYDVTADPEYAPLFKDGAK